MNIDTFLSRLEKVRQVGTDRWMASCPAHEDKGPSLSVRHAEDGRILVNDFGGGCTHQDICDALGIHVADLMPVRRERPYLRPEERGTNYTGARVTDVLELLDFHATRIMFVIVDALNLDARNSRRSIISAAERKELLESVRVIGDVRATIKPDRFRANERGKA